MATLRIRVFRQWPYLYDGSLHYEREYLRVYAEAPHSVVVLAFDEGTPVGASTGAPLVHEPDSVRLPFERHGLAVADTFYYGESVVDSAYRYRGLGARFFEERERHARSLGFTWAAFCSVERPETHPMRPTKTCDANGFWQRRGFQPTELMTEFSWRDVGDYDETRKPMRFWRKALS